MRALEGLPCRGKLRRFVKEPIDGMPIEIVAYKTMGPASQVIEDDGTNILVRAFALKDKQRALALEARQQTEDRRQRDAASGAAGAATSGAEIRTTRALELSPFPETAAPAKRKRSRGSATLANSSIMRDAVADAERQRRRTTSSSSSASGGGGIRAAREGASSSELPKRAKRAKQRQRATVLHDF